MASDVKYKGSVAAGIVAGTAIGVVTGLLIAPKNGEKTRKDIVNKTQEGIDKVKDKASDLKDTVSDKVG